MEDEFFEEFRYKDLSGIKKFNFKKAKAVKLSEKAISPLKDSIHHEELSTRNRSDLLSTCEKRKTVDLATFCRPSSSKCFLMKKEETSNLDLPHKSKLSPEFPSCHLNSVAHNPVDHSESPSKKFIFKKQESTGITNSKKTVKTTIVSGEGRVDTFLDNLYKNTVSKKAVDVSNTQRPLPLKLLPVKTEVASKTRIWEPSSDIRKNYSTCTDFEGIPSLVSGHTQFAFNSSKYFNNKLSSPKSHNLTPFKKLLEAKKCTNISKVGEKFSLDRVDNFNCIDSKTVTESSIPVTINDSSSTTSDSPVIKPKKFVFKKRPLKSSSCSSTQGKNSVENVFSENKVESEQYVSSSNDFSPVPDSVLKTNLNLKVGEGHSRDSDFSGYTQIPINEKKNKLDYSVSSSQSLEIADDDYMDDEEFDRQFGNLADQFDERDFNREGNDASGSRISTKSLTNTSQKLDHQETEELLKEISTLSWDDNYFEQEPIQEGFKDRNDDSDQFKGIYEHSEVMLEMLHQKFGLISFRPHQREIINASLKQHDCFVLMPTGGGKSLCYQLPAILMPGVTVVVSPLRALISDQVDKLNALDIAAAHLCSDVSKAECEQIYMKLSMREPTIKLLYLTPEKICASRVIIDILHSLYQRGKLARFVIDEVHCLSQWGHDFRPDYKQLSLLRTNYKDVPIICLTATATKQVEQDVINILGLKQVKRFIRSFNRPNIKYQVITKAGKGTTEEIANLINTKFSKMSGIVYCLSRQDCDNMAEKFNSMGIKSKPYHAGMNDKVRNVIQREWMQDRFHVIVATIAFGMGIDKPDVRFVIHNSIPKSVEAFYQESGRAGRDGEVSYSYLYYSYGDVARLQKLMQMDRNMSKKTFDAHMENLKQMVSFAENVVDCRRHLQLLHLGEHFDRRVCIRNQATICDNCENIDNYKTLDVTKEAKELCSLVKDLTSSENVTMLYVADVYRGSKLKKILERGHHKHPKYGAGATMDRNIVQRVLKDLILKHILNDFCTYTGDFPVVYMKTGPKFYQFFNSDCKLHLSVCTNKQRKKEVVLVDNGNNLNKASDWVNSTKPSTSTGVVRHTVQKQNTAKLQAARKLQLSQLKVQCHEELLEECRRLAMERNLTLSSVMNLSAIKTMSEMLPNSKEEMLKIQHVTNANYSKYGEFFLKITLKFRERHDALLPLTVNAINKNTMMSDMSDDEYQSDFCQQSSQEGNFSGPKRGAKRKGGRSGGKKWGMYKKRRVFKKKKGKASPKGKAAVSSGWKGKVNNGSGKLGLMPLHIK